MNIRSVRKRYFLFLLGLCVLFIMAHGFAGSNQKIAISAGIERYSTVMSSTPGIPLSVQDVNGYILRRVRYHWETDYGQFLRWDDRVQPLGSAVKTIRNQIYWGVDFKDTRDVTYFTIRVKVEDKKSGHIIAEAKLRIEKDRNGYFTVRDKREKAI